MVNRTASAAHMKRQSRVNTLLLMTIVGILLTIVFIGCLNQYQKLRTGRAQREALQTEIRKEQERAEEIEEYKKFTQTDAFIEEMAREKLGLVYDGEVIFKEKDN